jgi:hypothetical protein
MRRLSSAAHVAHAALSVVSLVLMSHVSTHNNLCWCMRKHAFMASNECWCRGLLVCKHAQSLASAEFSFFFFCMNVMMGRQDSQVATVDLQKQVSLFVSYNKACDRS